MSPQLPIALVRRIGVLAVIAMFSLLPASPAVAKCGTSELNGKWYIFSVAGGATVKIENGFLTGDEGVLHATYSVAQSANCLVTMGTDFGTFIGVTEAIPPASPRRPRIITVSSTSLDGSLWLVRR